MVPINISLWVFVHLLDGLSWEQVVAISVAAYPQLIISTESIGIDIEFVEGAAVLLGLQ